MPAPHVYKAINGVTEELARIGIEKNRKAGSGGGSSYYFRGIDDVYNALAPLLPAHGLVVIPRVINREVTERRSAADKSLWNVVLTVEFDFVSADDGSKHTAVAVGEAMDSGDKASNKAMSAAYKYACFQVFCIPTEGDNDSENASTGGVEEDVIVAMAKAVETAETAEKLDALWARIAKTCQENKDRVTYSAMKGKVDARRKELA